MAKVEKLYKMTIVIDIFAEGKNISKLIRESAFLKKIQIQILEYPASQKHLYLFI